jgi:hypothetical protein
MTYPQTHRISPGMSLNVKNVSGPIMIEYMSYLTYTFTS